MHAAKANVTAMAGHMDQPYSVVSTAAQQAGAADHDAGAVVELAGDHEQRDRDGHDDHGRRDVGPTWRCP
jgi:hypothetical protein